jgi:hypothetical protein
MSMPVLDRSQSSLPINQYVLPHIQRQRITVRLSDQGRSTPPAAEPIIKVTGSECGQH